MSVRSICRLFAPARQLLRRVFHWGRARQCAVCSAQVRRFLPLAHDYLEMSARCGFPHDLRRFELLNIDEYACPICHEPDRARLIALWIRAQVASGGLPRPWRLLDFAPGAGLSRLLRSLPGVAYRSADRYMEGVDDQVDITRLPYPDGSFDVFICSHVLEHVHQDRQALRELHRILAPGGQGVLLVPIALDAKQIDEEDGDGSIPVAESERWRRFGQDDHVRLYTKDELRRRIGEAGFVCNAFGVGHLDRDILALSALTPSSTLYVVSKPAAATNGNGEHA